MKHHNLITLKRLTIYLLCLSIVLYFGCGGDDETSNQTIPINYEIDAWCPATADITYIANEKQTTLSDTLLPWNYNFFATPGERIYLEATDFNFDYFLCQVQILADPNDVERFKVLTIHKDNLVFKTNYCVSDPNKNCSTISIDTTI